MECISRESYRKAMGKVEGKAGRKDWLTGALMIPTLPRLPLALKQLRASWFDDAGLPPKRPLARAALRVAGAGFRVRDTQLEMPRRRMGRDAVGPGTEGEAGSRARAGCWVQDSALQTKAACNFVVSEVWHLWLRTVACRRVSRW